MRFLIFLGAFFAAVIAGMVFFAAENGRADDAVVSSAPVFKPDMTHESDHLAGTTIAWDATMKTTNVPADTAQAHFVFYFTNVAAQVDKMLTTNITTVAYAVTTAKSGSPKARSLSPETRTLTVTNITWVTNSVTLLPVTVLDVHPSCGCTTAQLPTPPWTLPPGTNGQIGVTVNVNGRFGIITKSVHIGTDKGSCDLIVQINIQPRVITKPSDAQRMEQMQIAKVDRQAVFKNDCATCHMKEGQFKYGKDLYDADCGICHEAENRASMVPDLHNLKVATNEDFWRTWIAHGKAGTFMPAFSMGDGGPLSDMQIASLVAYLNSTIPSKVPSPQ
jgi:mono/diheme cytochrome c family protein